MSNLIKKNFSFFSLILLFTNTLHASTENCLPQNPYLFSEYDSAETQELLTDYYTDNPFYSPTSTESDLFLFNADKDSIKPYLETSPTQTPSNQSLEKVTLIVGGKIHSLEIKKTHDKKRDITFCPSCKNTLPYYYPRGINAHLKACCKKKKKKNTTQDIKVAIPISTFATSMILNKKMYPLCVSTLQNGEKITDCPCCAEIRFDYPRGIKTHMHKRHNI